jgi:hypothetical protein
MARTIGDFERTYHDTFLDERVSFTSNVAVDSWCIITSAQEFSSTNEYFGRFMGSFESLCKKKQY